MDKKCRILFVCMANICRSPAAEGYFKHLVQNDLNSNFEVESCGIGDWHVGSAYDYNIQEVSRMRGIPLKGTAKQFKLDYLNSFDYIMAADTEVLKILYQHSSTTEQKSKIHLMTAFSPLYKDEDVPDPYCRGGAAFEQVYDIIEDACKGLLNHIIQSQ